MLTTNYNPDVLSCLANLSNDEVFTPPTVVNQMLDTLPSELWSNPQITFLDPVCKTGIFLREIAKRLMVGLKDKIPDVQERANHIFTKQLYGIAITELTSLLSRRSLYCSKKANSQYSICTEFNDEQGNIIYQRIKHTWKDGKCIYCGASQNEYDRGDKLESYAYQFIHINNPEKIFNMRFDVIIGNPPYQLSDGGNGASAGSIYPKFIQQAKKLNPKYLCMIIPARWYSGGKGLDSFRYEMLHDDRIRTIHDFNNASDCFPNVEIKGGVCYFLWNRDSKGLCSVYTHNNNTITSFMERPLLEKNCDIFIRHNQAITILKKIQIKKEASFSSIVSSRKPFGFPTDYKKYTNDPFPESVKIYALKKQGYIHKNLITKNKEWINQYKILIPKAIGAGDMTKDWIKPILAEKNTCCTETYILIGPFDSYKKAENTYSYIQTKFFHFILGLKKVTQDTTSKVYSFIPLQDFSESWTDEKLYKKYGLTEDEIAFIESMIRPME
ncbi:MAG: Eco57I restriction-modification methylase domain-containing protein [Parabacteroides sp.]|nr:Eco57I restriction-modification methylase domain-containing protein [Parabacteroides sp.]